MINATLLAHVILKPHVHPEDILGVGVLALVVIVVLSEIVRQRRS